MKKEKLVDFSNVFSPKSQSLLAKHQQSRSQKVSPLSFSPLSPMAKPKPQFITNLPKVQDFRSMDKIKLSEQNIKNIMDSLDLQARAEKGLELRTKAHQLFLNFHENPFTKELTRSPRLDYEQQENIREVDIISEMANLHHTDIESKLRKRVQPLHSGVKDFYNRLKKEIQRSRRKVQVSEKENTSPIRDPDGRRQIYRRDDIRGLDEIINMKDDQFFRSYYKSKDRNIFQLTHRENHSDFRSNKEILEGYYFCIDSMVGPVVSKDGKKNKLHINHVESFSTYTRDLARNVIPKKMPDKMVLSKGDILISMDGLNFQEVMNVANNKLTSRALLEYFREEEIDSKKKAEDERNAVLEMQPVISYDNNWINRMDNHNPINQDKAEIDYYHRSSFTNIENRQQELSKKYFMKLKKVILEEADIVSKSIRDRSTLRAFKRKKENILTELLETNEDRRLDHFRQVQRNIRMNKMNKNRTEKLKINMLTEAFQIKRQMETSINKSMGKKEKRYSPMNTWRG